MENWGLVTYRETALLVDPENTSSGTKQWVALVVGTCERAMLVVVDVHMSTAHVYT